MSGVASRIIVGRDGSVGISALPSPPAGYRWQAAARPGFLPISARAWKRAGDGSTYAVVRAGNTVWLAVKGYSGNAQFYRAVSVRTDPYPIRGLARVGAAPDVSAVGSSLQAGDSYLGGSEWDNAVQAYRAAGQAAVTLSKQYSLTMPAGFGTGGPGDLNAQLQAIQDANDNPGTAATQATAQQAQGIAYQINGAIVAAAGAQGGGTPGGGTAPNAPGTNIDPLYQATLALQAYFQSNAPTTAAVSQVGGFQSAWNSSGAAALTVDSKYGPATQGAFQAALTAYGISGTAPQNAFSTTPVTPPPAPPLPSPGTNPSSNTVIVWWESLPLWQQLLLGGAAAGGTYFAGKAILKKHPVHRQAGRYAKRALGHLKRHAGHVARRLRPRRA